MKQTIMGPKVINPISSRHPHGSMQMPRHRVIMGLLAPRPAAAGGRPPLLEDNLDNTLCAIEREVHFPTGFSLAENRCDRKSLK
jgi:hypothetical protein